MTEVIARGMQIGPDIMRERGQAIPPIYLTIARADLCIAQVEACLEEAETAFANGNPAGHLAGEAWAQGHMLLLDQCITDLQDSYMSAGALSDEERQRVMTSLLRRQRLARERLEKIEDPTEGYLMELAENGESMPDLASSYGEIMTATTMRAAAHRCSDAVSASRRPYEDPMCTAMMIALDVSQDLINKFATGSQTSESQQADGETGRRVAGINAAMEADLRAACERYADGIETIVSERFTRAGEVIDRWINRTPDPTKYEFEILWTGHPEAQGLDDHGAPLIVISHVGRGKRNLWTLGEPMPAGTPETAAIALITRIEEAIENQNINNEPAMPESVQRATAILSRRMKRVTTLGLHTTTPEAMRGVIECARNQGRPEGQIVQMLLRMTEGDMDLARMLGSSSAVTMRIGSNEQAAIVLKAAASVGLDEHEMRHLCRLMGHDADDLLGQETAADLQRIAEVMNEAQRHAIPERPVVRMMEAMVSERQPFFHCRFDGEKFQLEEREADSTA